jgi:cysteine desulfurase
MIPIKGVCKMAQNETKKIYVDYAATTSLDPRVLEAMNPFFTESYGNPSSINSYGLKAKNAVEEARSIVSEMMNATPKEIVFTGSATEANNLALKGHAFREGREVAHIAVTEIEHDCVLNSAKWLEKQGYRVTYLPVDEYGILKLGELEEALSNGVSLVSVIHGNNEIGTVQPLKEIGKICRDYDAVFHTDAAQSYGKIPIDVEEMNVDMMTVNAHKLYGPKGVGSLYMRKGVRVEPLLHGGGQEHGLRSSTENVPGIVGFGKAVEIRKKEMKTEGRSLTRLRDRLTKNLLKIQDAYLNGHPSERMPNIANIRFSYIEGESLVLLLDDAGISASTGSACSSRTLEPSHVLLALGLKPELVHGSLRISLGKYNTEDDLDYIIRVTPKIVNKLREMSPVTPNDFK